VHYINLFTCLFTYLSEPCTVWWSLEVSVWMAWGIWRQPSEVCYRRRTANKARLRWTTCQL